MGHALGLGHSSRKAAVMYNIYPFEEGDSVDVALSEDDVSRIQAIYGIKGKRILN